MANWFSNAIAHIKFLLNRFQVRQFFAVVLVGMLLLTTNLNRDSDVYGSNNSRDITNKVLERVHENDAPRPKTTGEWEKDDRETANNLDERGRRITEQAGSALKEFGSGYAKAMKDATSDAKDSVERAGSRVVDPVR